MIKATDNFTIMIFYSHLLTIFTGVYYMYYNLMNIKYIYFLRGLKIASFGFSN